MTDKEQELKHDSPVHGYAKCLEMIFIAYGDNTIIAWDMSSGKKQATYSVDFCILDIQFENNCLLVVGIDKSVRITSFHFDRFSWQRDLVIDEEKGAVIKTEDKT